MKKILNIISSAKGNESFSNKLSNVLLEKLLSAYPGSNIFTRDLSKDPVPHLEESHFTSFYTPEASRTEAQKEAVRISDQAINEIMDADVLVIGAPLYNFGIPSTLKSWIDQIARAGVTFSYANGTPQGLVKNKKIYLVISSGGVYSQGPMKEFDFTEPYLRKVLGFIGLTDITVFRVEGTVVTGRKETALTEAIERVKEYAL